MKVIFEGKQDQPIPARDVVLSPGENDLPDALAVELIAAGIVKPGKVQSRQKPRDAKGPEE